MTETMAMACKGAHRGGTGGQWRPKSTEGGGVRRTVRAPQGGGASYNSVSMECFMQGVREGSSQRFRILGRGCSLHHAGQL